MGIFFSRPKKKPDIKKDQNQILRQLYADVRRQHMIIQKQKKKQSDQNQQKLKLSETLMDFLEKKQIYLQKLSNKYILNFNENYSNIFHDNSGMRRSGFETNSIRKTNNFWIEIHKNSIYELKNKIKKIVIKLKNKVNSYRLEKDKKLCKKIILENLILKPIGNENEILYKYFTETQIKKFELLKSKPLQNIYINYMLLGYLIQSEHFDFFLNKEDLKDYFSFELKGMKQNLLIIRDNYKNEFKVHRVSFHPDLYIFFKNYVNS